jgi:large subunit ribosomal protein L17
MRHRKAGRKFGRNSSNRAAMFKNQVQSLLEYERIETTVPKAKEVRGIAERLITLGKRGGLHSIRLVERVVRKKSVITKLFEELGPRFKDRPGGYTRIVRTRRRLGDGAPMGFLELLPPPGGRPAKGAPEPEAPKEPKSMPGSTYPGELDAGQKVGRLDKYLREFGSYQQPQGPYAIDIRHWQEITRKPLVDPRDIANRPRDKGTKRR